MVHSHFRKAYTTMSTNRSSAQSIFGGIAEPRKLLRKAWSAPITVPLTASAILTLITLGCYLKGYGNSVSLLGLVCVVFTTVVAVETDLRERIIPNWLTYGSTSVALLMSAGVTLLSANGWDSRWLCLPFGESATGAVLCFSGMFGLFLWAGTGGGDVKLATAWGAVLGLETSVMVVVGAYLIAFLLWPCYRLFVFLRGISPTHRSVPMAPFFSLALIFFQLGARLW